MTTVTTQFFVYFLVQHIFILYHFNLSFQWNIYFALILFRSLFHFVLSFRLNIHYGHFLRNSIIFDISIKIKDVEILVEIRFGCNPNFYSPKFRGNNFFSFNQEIPKETKQNSILMFQFMIRLALTCECICTFCMCLLIFLPKFHQFDIFRVNKQGKKMATKTLICWLKCNFVRNSEI